MCRLDIRSKLALVLYLEIAGVRVDILFYDAFLAHIDFGNLNNMKRQGSEMALPFLFRKIVDYDLSFQRKK
jgi:hypothetical protein